MTTDPLVWAVVVCVALIVGVAVAARKVKHE